MGAQVFDMLGFFRNTLQQGFKLADNSELGQLIKLLFSAPAAVTALAGGGQAGATPLTGFINVVGTVASSADSVMLPQALSGRMVVVINGGANSMQVFGQLQNPSNANAGDTIAAHNSNNQTATGTGVAQASTVVAIYFCIALGQWKQLITA